MASAPFSPKEFKAQELEATLRCPVQLNNMGFFSHNFQSTHATPLDTDSPRESNPCDSSVAEGDPDLRVSAISIASQTIMATVGAWSGVISRRFCPFRRMRVWEDDGDTEFCSDDIDCSELGYIVENRVFSNQILPVKMFRNFGLGLAERLQPAKNKAMRYAIGLEGNLPKLARGEMIVGGH